ncbi:MAG: N-acyl homoserine lactonase family protein [Actinobacteria bacterium]|nr:N-acyl homoserine lactonase family protein [Actinomycetota bacterium]
MATPRIIPLNFGDFPGIEKSVFTLAHNQGVKMKAPCLGFLIHAEGRNILVDTGPSTGESSIKYHNYEIQRPKEWPEILSETGVTPRMIDTVVFTHLHWDHCYNLEHLTKASFLVQREELRYAIAPLPPHRVAYEMGIPGLTPSWLRVVDRIRVIDGDAKIAAGVELVHLPGHTPGFQGVAVKTGGGTYLIVGDNVALYETWAGRGIQSHLVSGIYVNLEDYFRSVAKIERIADPDHLLPGHDPLVLQRSIYE